MASPLGKIASQSIHITPIPQPTTLAESKLILTALQKFGEVVTFRNLKYDTTNTSEIPFRPILAIFDTPDAAKQALSASPLTIHPDSGKRRKPIKCDFHPSRHNHESALLRNPFHTAFRVHETYQLRDLVKTGIPLRELADETLARKRHEPLRVKRRIERENRRLGATSLVGLYREGLGEREKEKEGREGDNEGREGER